MSDAELRPDPTAVWTALWRALHVEVDDPPHVFVDELGAHLVDPGGGWRDRPEASARAVRRGRGSIVARARLIEDHVLEQARAGVDQYVILGAGLDSFALRRPDGAAGIDVFEIDQPTAQAWKQQRLAELDIAVPPRSHFVPVDFETDEDWPARLAERGFDRTRPAAVAAAGVTPYLTDGAVLELLQRLGALAPGSTAVVSFLVPVDHADADEQPSLLRARADAERSGAPFVSFYTPVDFIALATRAGLTDVRHVSAADLTARYFADRTDGLRPSSSEHLVIAAVA